MKSQNVRKILIVLGSLALAMVALNAEAGPKAPQKSVQKVSPQLKSQLQGRLSTKMAFTGAGVKGQYQVPAEATAQIESEKPLEELLGLRTEFRDRIKAESERDQATGL